MTAGRRSVKPLVPRVRPSVELFEPVWVSDIEISRPIPDIPDSPHPGRRRYARAVSYVRWSGVPIGAVWMTLPVGGLDALTHAEKIWAALGSDLRAHAEVNGNPSLSPLGATGYRLHAPPEPRSSQTPHVTVVIATRDRPEMLHRCLRSLLDVDYPSFDVVVVDNAPSSDTTTRLIEKSFADDRVSCVVEPTPGLARAHNRGLAEASGELVAFTDDDVIVDRGWLPSIVDAFEDDAVACVTGLILPRRLDTRAQWWLEGYAGYGKGLQRRYFDLDSNRPGDRLFPYTAGRLGSGANMSFRTEFLRSIGGFDPALGVGSPAYGGDDLAAFFEVLTTGNTLVYEPSAIVHHEHPESEDALWRQVFGYGAGLTAYLTKTLVDDPSRALAVAVRAPQAVWYVLSSRSVRNESRSADFPVRLRWRELAGMAIGPIAYLRSRRRAIRAGVSGTRRAE